jgi:hypothetical protein
MSIADSPTKGGFMARIRREDSFSGDPLSEGEDKAETSGLGNSGNREESMVESGKDAFGRGSAIRNPDQSDQVGWDRENPDAPDENTTGARRSAPSTFEETQNPRTSGTTGLTGETRDEDSRKGPGGVEGTG